VADDSHTFSAGRLLGRYELLAPVAKGGMGQVWLARLRGARGFHKLVAVKTLLPVASNDERMQRMLHDEARIASLIHHPNVVQTLELGDQEGCLYMIMEWVDGEPLSHLLSCAERAGGFPIAIGVNLVAQTLRGLQAAHELCDRAGESLGVVHRDVSPHNVLVSYAGVAKLLDFGIAKAMNELSSSTATGEIKGKFAYMAPEQILGGAIDQRADLFAAGIMLYLLTTGRHPFKNHSSAGVLHSITGNEPVLGPRTIVEDYPEDLEFVVLKALARDRERRWRSADEMRRALEAALPQAFAPEVVDEIRSFIKSVTGDRAAHKREALRRALLAADSKASDGTSDPAALGPAQSAGSLRAVSISDDERVVLEPESQRPSHAPTARPPAELERPARRGRGPAGFAVLGLAALVAAFALFRDKPRERALAATPAAAMSDAILPPHTTRVPPAPARMPAPVSTASAAAHDAASSAAPPAPIPARPATRLPVAHKMGPAGSSARKKAESGTDLIAPDYAR